ncbi:MAG: thioredoxin family protein [Candidatus Bathyarchaeota archaeon]|nr:thioredoxin family protein [Candidatus Bathyarchaeota archaeon]
MKKIEDINAEEFNYKIKSINPILIEFWQKTCENCKKFKAIYEQLAEIFDEEIEFTRIEIFKSVENLRLAESLGVEETPTIKIFKNGKEIGEIVGFKKLETATENIKKIINQ